MARRLRAGTHLADVRTRLIPLWVKPGNDDDRRD
jgi:hypothetical protein